MKKILGLGFVSIATCFLLAPSVAKTNVAVVEKGVTNRVTNPQDGTWTNTGIEAYNIDENGVITMNNANPVKNNNFFLTDSYDAYGNYTISLKAKGTLTLPISGAADAGIVPWYVDSNNYIVVYMAWGDGCDRPDQMRNLQITGKIDGKNPFKKVGSVWSASEWNDVWADGVAIPPSGDNTLTVTKRISETKDSFVIEYDYNNGRLSGSIEFRDIYKYLTKEAKVGVYAHGDSWTFNNFTFQGSSDYGVPYELGDGVAVSEKNSFAISGGQTTFDATGASTHVLNKYVENNTFGTNPFEQQLTVDVTGNDTDYGVYTVPFYENEYSYLHAGIKVVDGVTKAGFDGRITTNTKSKLSNTYIDDFVTIPSVDLNDDIKLKVVKISGKFKLYVDDTLVHTYEDTYFASGSVNYKSYGYSVIGVRGKIVANTIAETYEPFSWVEEELNGTTWYVSANDKNSVSYDATEQAYVIGNAAIDSNTPTMAYRRTGRYGNVSAQAKITSDLPAGLVAYLGDINNYINVYLETDGITVINSDSAGITTNKYAFENEPSFTPGSEVLLSTVIENKTLTVLVGEVVVLTGKTFPQIDLHYEAYAGITTYGVTGSFKEFKYSGFRPLDPIDVADFTFFGQRPDSWSYDQENGIIQNKLIEGVPNGWKATNALYKNTEQKDLFMGSAIQVLSRSGNEFKVGIMPYWKDADNHLIVWFSQWEGSGSMINATCRINGQVVGQEWRESSIGVDIMRINYIEAEIKGDTLKVYVNKSFEPNFTTTFDGFSNRDMELAFTGFQVGNGIEARFTEFTMLSNRRIYMLYEQPAIEEMGTRVTEGTVGERIKLPVYAASNSQGDALEAVVTVLDPNGNVVTLEKNGFTPQIAGEYQVRVTCVDNWGTEAEPIEYVITVVPGETPDEPDTPDVPTPGEPGEPAPEGGEEAPIEEPTNYTGIIIGSVIGGVALLAGIGVGIYFIIKKKKA